MNENSSEYPPASFSDNHLEAGQKASKVPSVPETFVVIFVTIGFIFFVTIIFLVISLFYPLDVELLLVEAFIIIPAVVFVKIRGYSLRHVFRFNSIDRNQFYTTIVIGLSLIFAINFFENWLQSLPYPDLYYDVRSSFESDIVQMLTINSFYKFIVLFLAVIFFAAICEEMFFRGFVQQSFENRLSSGWAIFLTALMFSILHPFSLVPILLFAVIIGIISRRSNSIIPTIIIHALNNGVSLYALNTSEEIQADPSQGINVPFFLFVISLAVLYFSMRYYFRMTDDQIRDND